MTPVLAGRWQTRTLAMWTIGLLMTILVSVAFNDQAPYYFLFYVWVIGMVADVAYDRIQTMRWEHDWTPLHHFITGVVEGGIMWMVASLVTLPGLPDSVPLDRFLIHYVVVFVFVFAMVWGGMKVLFPTWRFSGGRFI